MPLYSFFNEKTEETIDIFMSMNDKHEYIDGDGFQWRRIFHVPMAAKDTQIDPRNKNDFVRRTEKYSTVGDMFSISKEMSEKRESKDGRDQVKEAYFKKYSADRRGKCHPESRPKKIENDRVLVDLTTKS